MAVGRFSTAMGGVGVLTMPDAGLNTMQSIESVCMVLLGAAGVQLLVPGIGVGVIIARSRVANKLKVTY
jgi:hypothetical protein